MFAQHADGPRNATNAWRGGQQSHAQPDSVIRMTYLEGRVIAIAGAGGGLGPVVAQRLADRHQEIADRVARDLGVAEDRVHPHAVDLLDPDAAVNWATEIQNRFGR